MANYLKQGTYDNFIFDSAEIELAKFNNLRYSVMGYMLGDFNEQGIYTVDSEIVKELISLKKYVVNVIDNVEVCYSELKLINPITFLITFEEDCATLSLVEKISHEGNFKENGGSFSDINEYVLDRIETSGVVNREVIYRRWNVGEFSGNVLDVNSLNAEAKAELFGLIGRFKYLLYVNTALLEKEELLEEEELNFAEDMSKLLLTFPKLKELVDKSVKTKLNAKKDFIRIDKPFVARTLNEIVEQSIAENINVLKPKELEEFKAGKHEIVNQHNLRMSAIIPVKVNRVDFDIENSYGVVKADTELLTVGALSKSVEVELDEPVYDRNKESKYSLIDLQKALVAQHKNVEERLIDSAVKLVVGQDGVTGIIDSSKMSRNARLKNLYGDFQNNISNATKKRVEEFKTSITNAEKSNSLIAKKVAPITKATTKDASKAKDTATKSAAPKAAAKKPDTKKAATAKAPTKAQTKGREKSAATKTNKTNEFRVNVKVRTSAKNEFENQPVAENKTQNLNKNAVVTEKELNANNQLIEDVGGFDLRKFELGKNVKSATATSGNKKSKVKTVGGSNKSQEVSVNNIREAELTEEELGETNINEIK